MTPEQELAALRDAVLSVVPVLLMAQRNCTTEQGERINALVKMVTKKGAK